jgi:hypothetical protein
MVTDLMTEYDDDLRALLALLSEEELWRVRHRAAKANYASLFARLSAEIDRRKEEEAR